MRFFWAKYKIYIEVQVGYAKASSFNDIEEYLDQPTASAISQISYETFVTIILAALGVILAAVTLFATLVAIVIAVVAIWGIKEIKTKAAESARKAVESAIKEYPDAREFLDIYRSFRQQLVTFQQEYAKFKEDSSNAAAILVRLNSTSAAPPPESPLEEAVTPIGAAYPKEANP